MVTGTWGGGNDSVKIWDVNNGKVIQTLASENFNTCVSSNI